MGHTKGACPSGHSVCLASGGHHRLALGTETGDLDADGRQDLLVHNQGGDVVFWGVDGGGFRAEPIDVAGELALAPPLPRAWPRTNTASSARS